MTVSEIFSMDCRGTVFDLPCPTSFIAGEVKKIHAGVPRRLFFKCVAPRSGLCRGLGVPMRTFPSTPPACFAVYDLPYV